VPPATAYKSLEFSRLLEQLAGFAQSSLTRALILELEVVFHPGRIEENLDQTAEALEFLEAHPGIELPYFNQLEDLSEVWQRLSAGELADPQAARAILRFLELCAQFDALLAKLNLQQQPRLMDQSSAWQTLASLLAETKRIFDPEGQVRDNASSELAGIRRKLRQFEGSVKSALRELLQQIHNSTGEEALLTIRHQRFCLVMPRSAVRIAPGSVIDVSQSGQSVYFEPSSLSGLNLERQQLFLDEEQELRSILRAYSQRIAASYAGLSTNQGILARFDYILARVRQANELRARRPRMVHDGGFRLQRAVHPLLHRSFVPEDLVFDGQKALIVSGVNAGGKTVLLKLLGLYSLMAAIGCFVPGEAQLPYVEDVLVYIGDEQSTVNNLSTFTAHLSFLKELFGRLESKPGARPLLVLIDEIGTGTEPSEGQAFAYGLITTLLDYPVLVAVTTHFDLLKTIGLEREDVKNVSLQFDRQQLKPTFRILDNQPGASFALEIAERWALPAQVLERARSVLGTEEQRMSSVISQLESLREQAETAQRAAVTQAAQIEQMRLKNQDLTAELKLAKQKFAQQAEQMKAEMKRRIEEMLEETKRKLKNKARQTSRKQDEYVKAASKTSQLAARQEEQAEAVLSQLLADLDIAKEEAPAVAEIPRLGDEVIVSGSNLRGTVAEVNPAQGSAILTVFGKRVIVKLNQLRPATAAQEPADPLKAFRPRKQQAESAAQTAAGRPAIEHSFSAGLQDSSDTLDLHGYTVEEALEMLDEFMSRVLLGNATTLRFMHGVGTGRLKQAVHDYLKRSKHITNIRQASVREGGMGVTLADVK